LGLTHIIGVDVVQGLESPFSKELSQKKPKQPKAVDQKKDRGQKQTKKEHMHMGKCVKLVYPG
jgi:hypothetical protein